MSQYRSRNQAKKHGLRALFFGFALLPIALVQAQSQTKSTDTETMTLKTIRPLRSIPSARFDLPKPFPQTQLGKQPGKQTGNKRVRDDQQAIVGGHGEMLIMQPTAAERLEQQRQWEAEKERELNWVCKGADTGSCANEAFVKLKDAGCVLEQDPDTLAEKRVTCFKQPNEKIHCETTSRNCNTPWRYDKGAEDKLNAKQLCGREQKTANLDQDIGDICISSTVKEERPDSGKLVAWACSNPPFVDSELCFADFKKRAEGVGCEFSATASHRDCQMVYMENGFILGRSRQTTWVCQSEVLNCRASQSGSCPAGYKAFGPTDDSVALEAGKFARYVCRLNSKTGPEAPATKKERVGR